MSALNRRTDIAAFGDLSVMNICGVFVDGTDEELLQEWLSSGDIEVQLWSLDDVGAAALQTACEAIIVSPKIMEGQHRVRELSEQAPVIVIDDNPSIEKAVIAIRSGAHDYLASHPVKQLPSRISSSIRSFHQVLQQFDLSKQFIGNCPQINELRALIQTIGPTDGPALICGPTGTGKNLAAKCIHATSLRAHRPLMTLNCDRVPTELVLTELFGDSRESKPHGRLAQAHTGTLFLNEIGALPLAAQARLLQFLESGTFQQYPSNKTMAIDARIIAASHSPLNDLATQENFKNDLLLRLSQFVVTLPLLADRGNDIALLATWFLSRHQHNLGKRNLKLHADALKVITSYHWPGNVRELDQAIERAVLFCEGTTILPQHLAITADEPRQPESDQSSGEYTSLDDYFIEFVRANEDRYTETEIAEKLGISRKSLWERRNKFGIPRRKTRIKRLHS